MSINAAYGADESRVVEMAALKTEGQNDELLQSTTFNNETVKLHPGPERSALSAPAPSPAPDESASDREELSSASITSTETDYSTDLEEHRHLNQSPSYLSLHEQLQYSSFSCSSCRDSDSDQSYSTLEDNAISCSPMTTDMEEDFGQSSDDDAHYKLIQPPIPRDQLEFWTLYDTNSSSSLDEYESSQEERRPPIMRQVSERVQIQEERHEFCVQCNAWPEVAECNDRPRKFYDGCHHTRLDPLECAFGSSVYFVTKSLSLVDETPAAVAKRKALETVLRSQFYLLIQQFAVDPEKVARTLYGISVIDMNDLEIATTYTLPLQERAKVLAVSLVRRLRRWPNLFGDVCKVLSDIPVIQEANAKVRQLLYEECSEDQYTKILEKNAQQQHQSTENLHNSIPELSTSAHEHHQSTENIDESLQKLSTGAKEERSHHISEDSVSFSSKLSKTSEAFEEVDPDTATNKSSNTDTRANLRLHESCLENRSVRSLDALISSKEVDIDTRDKNGRTPLIVACLCLPTENPNARIVSKQRKKIKSLLAKGADSTIQDYDGNTALHIAALRRDQEVVRLLLDRAYTKEYFNIATTNKNSRTALHYACYWGEMELVLPLLELEKEMQSGLLNVRDRNGDTGLHIACRGGFKPIVKELLKANASKDIQNKEGKTAADVAMEAKHIGIAKLMRKKKLNWFSRKKLQSDHVDGDDRMRRSPSNDSILSDHSDDVFQMSGESDMENSDTKPLDMEL